MPGSTDPIYYPYPMYRIVPNTKLSCFTLNFENCKQKRRHRCARTMRAQLLAT
jgi:hypothetical protein